MKKLVVATVASIMLFALAGTVQAGIPNPAAVYCSELGYEVKTITAEDGGQYSVCVFPDDVRCDAWKFLEGTCGETYSYCARNGYGQVLKADGESPFTRTYPVCIDGTTEIGTPLNLMGLIGRLLPKPLAEEEALTPLATSHQEAQELLEVALPAAFDWRTYNGFDWMTPVKDQSQCGSCWAFGSVGTVEVAYNLHQGQPNLDINLSEEYVSTDCNGNGKSGCCGGRHEDALTAIRDNGVPDDACLVYDVATYNTSVCSCDGPGDTCRATCPNGAGTSDMCSLSVCDDACFDVGSRLVNITDFYDAGALDRDLMKANLIAHGPLTAALNFGGVTGADNVMRCGCGNDCGTDHCVIITGYDDALGAWIIKNSWGNNDGPNADGYRLVAYGDCNLETRPVWVAAADIYFPVISVAHDMVFDDTCVDGTSYDTLNICNTGKADLSVFEIASDNAQFEVTTPLMDCHDLDGDGIVEAPDECSGGFPVLISQDFCYPFQVEFSPTAAGQQTATLTVRSNDMGHPSLSIAAEGSGTEADISVAIANAGDFGEVCVGAFADLNLSLLNQGSCDLTISGISADDPRFILPDVTTFPLVLSAGTDFNLPIRFEPGACGPDPITGTLTISSDDPDESSLLIDVSGSSPCPDIQAAIANAGDFGDVCKTDFKDLDLTLFNQGHCDLEISSIVLVGSDPTWFDLPTDLTFPLVLSPDADFRFPVRFSPDECSDAARTAQVRITSDDPDEGTVNIDVSGTAPCPNLVIDPGALADLYAFPATVVDVTGSLGCFSERSAVLRNNGECPLTISSISAAGSDFAVTAPTMFPVVLPSGEETLAVTVRFLPQADANPLAPSEVLGELTVLSDDPDGDSAADLCGESVAQSGVRILVTDVSSGAPVVVGEVDSLTLQSKGKRLPSPVNLQFTDLPVTTAPDICGTVIRYHVDQESLGSVGTTGSNPNSSYQAKAREGNLQVEQSFILGQCEFREFQLELQDSDSPTCLLLPKGASCTTDGECCSGRCKGRAGGKTCK